MLREENTGFRDAGLRAGECYSHLFSRVHAARSVVPWTENWRACDISYLKKIIIIKKLAWFLSTRV